MTTQRFKTTVAKAGSRTFIALPFDPNEVWGVKQRHHITGSINGCAMRGSLGADGSQYFLPLGAAWRRDNSVAAGAEVEVELSPEGPQADALAPDIGAALESEPEARAFFEALATFYRNGYIRWIEGARRPETRQARVTSGVSDSIQPSSVNLEAAYAVQNSCPAIPAVEGIVATRPERWARRTGSTHG